MGSIANQRAREVFGTAKMTFIGVELFFLLINSAVNGISDRIDFLPVTILSILIQSVTTACSSCFYFRAFNRGTPDTADVTVILNMKEHYSTIAAIALVQFAITAVTDLVSRLFSDMLLLSFVFSLGSFFISILFSAVWYLFIANPHYSTADYFNASIKYMGSHLWGYIGFESFHIFIILIVGCLAVFLNVLGILFFIPFIVMYLPYVLLAIAGYVSLLIPDEWYAGTATVTF